MLTPLFPMPMAIERFRNTALHTTKFSTSATRSKKKGDSESPCLRPLCNLIVGDGEPFIKIDADAVMTQALIH